MTTELSKIDAQEKIANALIGCSIQKVTYHITGWELRLIGAHGPEQLIYTSAVLVPNIEQWWSSLRNTPLDLNDTNEKEDTIAALCIFTVLNKWPVRKITIALNGDIALEFSNHCIIVLPGTQDVASWEWQIVTHPKTFAITCDNGAIYLSVDKPVNS